MEATDELDDLRRYVNDRVLREVSSEKAQAVINQAMIARVMQKTGSLKMEGIGQKMGAIDARTFFRWQQQYPGCWKDPNFLQEMLRDNPAMRAPGYTPKVIRKATETKVYAQA